MRFLQRARLTCAPSLSAAFAGFASSSLHSTEYVGGLSLHLGDGAGLVKVKIL